MGASFMATFEGGVLRVYRLPIIVEAADQEEARRKIEDIYRGMQADYDGGQDVFHGMDLPASQWPVEEIEEDPTGVIQWTSWAI
jgi:hypothetical protein